MTTSEQRYVALRTRLDQLGFQQPLGMESLPLVQRLLADLVRTTTSLKNARKGAVVNGGGPGGDAAPAAATSVAIGMALGQSSLDSYKAENARLVRENTDVHLKLLRAKEDHENAIKALKADMRKSEHQNTDLRFLNSQYLHKIGVLEREADDKTKRILKLQEHNFQAIVHTPGGVNKKTVPFRRQRMDIESLLDEAQSAQISTEKAAPVNVDLVAVADKRIQNMEQELAVRDESLSSMSASLKTLQQSVSSRDSEILRLHRLLDGGRPEAAVDAAAREDSMQRMVTRLDDQLQLLREENQALHDQVANLKAESGGNRSGVIVENGGMSVSAASGKTTVSPLGQSSEIRRELESLTLKVSDLKTTKENLLAEKEAEIARLTAEVDENSERVEIAEAKIQEVISDAEDTKQKMHLEAEESKKALEEEMSRVQSESRTYEELMLKEREERESARHLLQAVEGQADEARVRVGKLESDLRECQEQMKTERSHATTISDQLAEKREIIVNLENQIHGLQKQFQEISDDKDRTLLKLHRADGEVERLQTQLIKAQNKDLNANNNNSVDLHCSDRLVAYSVVTRLESEREALLTDRQRLKAEKEALAAEKDAAVRMSAEGETDKLRRIGELEARLDREEREKENLATECGHLRETLQTMRQHMQTMEQQVQLSVDELRSERQHASDFRLETSAREKEALDLRRRLAEAEAEAKRKEEDWTASEAKGKAESLKIARMKKELERVKAALATVDRERDLAQEALDDKTERLSSCEAHVEALKTNLKMKEEEVRGLEAELDRLSSELDTREKQSDYLRADLQSYVDAERDWRLETEALTRRSRQMTDDADELTREIERAERDKEELRKRLAEMEDELNQERVAVSHASQMVSGSQSQHEEMLLQMQAMNSQMLELELRVRDVEAENARLQTESEARYYEKTHISSHLDELQTRLRRSEEEISARETRSQSLATEVEDLKMDLNNARQTIETLEKDLLSLRGLAAQLDASKDKVQLELANKDALCQQLGKEITARDEECLALRSALLQEQSSTTNLESVVATSREREFVEQLEREKTQEILEQKLRQLEKVEEENRGRREEVVSLRRYVADLESSRSSLEAEVTKYQYEAELSGRSSTSSLLRAGGGGKGRNSLGSTGVGGGEKAVLTVGEAGDGQTEEILLADPNNNDEKENNNNNNDDEDANSVQRRKGDLSHDALAGLSDKFSPRSRDDNSEATLKDISAIESDREAVKTVAGAVPSVRIPNIGETAGLASALPCKASNFMTAENTASVRTPSPRNVTPSPRLVPQPDPHPTPHLASASLNASLQPSPIPSNASSSSGHHRWSAGGRRSPLSSTPASAVTAGSTPRSSRAATPGGVVSPVVSNGAAVRVGSPSLTTGVSNAAPPFKAASSANASVRRSKVKESNYCVDPLFSPLQSSDSEGAKSATPSVQTP